MAPSKALSYLRGHRRTGSTPSSPQPSQWPDQSPSIRPDPSASPSNPQRFGDYSPVMTSPISPTPPMLPPIPRIASTKYRSARTDDDGGDKNTSWPPMPAPDPPREPSPALPPIPRVSSITEKSLDSHKYKALPDPPQEAGEVVQLSSQSKDTLLQRRVHEQPRYDSKASTFFSDLPPFSDSIKPAWNIVPASEIYHRPTTPAVSHAHSLDPSMANPTPHKSVSPSSSMSSFHKTASSTNLAFDSSPASSRSAQGSTSANPQTQSNNPNPRLSKAKMTLLNPVSLLKRRRTSMSPETPESAIHKLDVPAMKLPEDYDPRIKGNVVHDFNAPRPKRNYTTGDLPSMAEQSPPLEEQAQIGARTGATPTPQTGDEPGSEQQRREKEHLPIFVEDFADVQDEESGSSAVQRESLANSSFLARMSQQLNFNALGLSEASPPGQSTTPSPESPHHRHARSSKTDASSYRISSDQSTIQSSVSNETKATSPPQSPPRGQSRTSSTLDPPFNPQLTLKHEKSSASQASRFSFQLNSDRCVAQEKALEEKHNERAATKVSKHVSLADSRFEELEEDNADDYDVLDDGGYEEQIPGVNADAGDDDMFLLSSPRSRLSLPVHAVETPRTGPSTSESAPPDDSMENKCDRPAEQALKHNYTFTDLEATPRSRPDPLHRAFIGRSSSTDDLYFDDGIIDGSSPDDQNDFDEAAAFDSPVQSLFDQKPDLRSSDSKTSRRKHPGTISGLPKISTQDLDKSSRTRSSSTADQLQVGSGQGFVHRQKESFEKLSNPTGSLHAYHSALANATSRAAKDGKFERQSSILTASSKYSDDVDDKGIPVQDEDETKTITLPQKPTDDDGGIPDDFSDDEDLMVAEANAEVLASEEAEFYGREFGFYQASSTGDAASYHGGVFSELERARSNAGQNISREPNLTPITERSEYSTRNSFISLAGPPSALPSSTTRERDNPFSSPALKDLAANVGLDDDDMTLSQLMKLRKETFGTSGSNRSSIAGAAAGSSDGSSPSSLNNSSPLGNRFHGLPGAQHPFATQAERRSSGDDNAIPEVPEAEDDDAEPALFTSSPSYDASRKGNRQSSAESLAREYSGMVDSLRGKRSEPTIREGTLSRSSQSSLRHQVMSGATHEPSAFPPNSEPVSSPPPAPLPAPNTLQSPAPSPAAWSQHQSPMSPPMPSSELMSKFSSRPPPDAYRKSWQPSQRNAPSPSVADSVAYVQEADEEGNMRWYLERRRKKSEGELVVVGRTPVEGGRI